MDRERKIILVMGAYFLICTLAMIWPGAVIANRVEPMIFGLPFLFFWYVLWVFMVFIGTVIFSRTTGNGVLPLAPSREPGTPLRFIPSPESAAPELFESGNEPFYAVAPLV